jgi:hypothetical protein
VEAATKRAERAETALRYLSNAAEPFIEHARRTYSLPETLGDAVVIPVTKYRALATAYTVARRLLATGDVVGYIEGSPEEQDNVR